MFNQGIAQFGGCIEISCDGGEVCTVVFGLMQGSEKNKKSLFFLTLHC